VSATDGHGTHEQAGAPDAGLTPMAVSATLHCLTGCAIGEVTGLVIGTAAGLGNLATIVVSVALAFLFGYTLSTLPLLKAGLSLKAAAGVVLAADTLSILTMETVDNLVMVVIPGAMEAGLVNTVFWVSMVLAFLAAFAVALPVNRMLLVRGKGHALIHHHHGHGAGAGWQRRIPVPATATLVAALSGFMLGGLVVSLASELGAEPTDPPPVDVVQH
jgi:hypothetical protein